jgi:hypothetical protein
MQQCRVKSAPAMMLASLTSRQRYTSRLPASGWGLLIIDTAAPRTAAAWTATGTSHELRGLKQQAGDNRNDHSAMIPARQPAQA